MEKSKLLGLVVRDKKLKEKQTDGKKKNERI